MYVYIRLYTSMIPIFVYIRISNDNNDQNVVSVLDI